MANCAVINGIGLSTHAIEQIRGGSSAMDLVLEFAANLPEVDKPIFLSGAGSAAIPDGYTVVDVQGDSAEALLSALKRAAAGYDHCFYLYGDCPLYDGEAALRMYENHKRYYAQYTFADGYPYGITPEILKVDVIPALITLAAADDGPISRSTLFDVIQKDINAFDIETDLAPKDMRMLRASLTCDTRRNTLLTKRAIDNGAKDAASVIDVLDQNPEILRTLPAYVNMQIVDGCPQACTYCPFPVVAGDVVSGVGFMPIRDVMTVAEEIARFAGDAVLGVSLWGEPARHPEIYGNPGCLLKRSNSSHRLPLYAQARFLDESDRDLVQYLGTQTA